MPELPEVETIRRELEEVILNKTITEVKINNSKVIKEPKPKDFAKSLTGVRIRGVSRKGKLLILDLSSGKFLAIHLRMTGQLIYPGDALASRVSFRLSNKKWLDFNNSRLLGELRLVDDWKELKFIKQLGVEPFNLSPVRFKDMLASRKSKIKTLLLDQKFISGIGNIYAAEVLFHARIHPERLARSLSSQEQKALLSAIKMVLKKAIRYKGSSVDDYVQVSGDVGEYSRYHQVYSRAKKPCFVCKTPIQRFSLGGRGTYFCPKCQK